MSKSGSCSGLGRSTTWHLQGTQDILRWVGCMVQQLSIMIRGSIEIQDGATASGVGISWQCWSCVPAAAEQSSFFEPSRRS